jgi:hypothetical protein
MNPKITADHVSRAAVVYVRQSTMAQVTGNLESQRRQLAAKVRPLVRVDACQFLAATKR